MRISILLDTAFAVSLFIAGWQDIRRRTLSHGICISLLAKEQLTPVAIPSTPAGDKTPSASWIETTNGTDKSYYANLSISAAPSAAELKSGYGFEVALTAKVDTNYPILPVSPYSQIGARKWYVPVWWPDGKTYEAVITAYGASTPVGELIASTKVSIRINGSMFYVVHPACGKI